MDELPTTQEAALLLGKAPRTIRSYIAHRLSPVARRVNPCLILVRRVDVEQLRVLPPAVARPARVADECASISSMCWSRNTTACRQLR